jgi:hypothetical protein
LGSQLHKLSGALVFVMGPWLKYKGFGKTWNIGHGLMVGK